jgi:rare lipoprotein A
MLVHGTSAAAAPMAQVAPIDLVAMSGEPQSQPPVALPAALPLEPPRERVRLRKARLNVLAGHSATVTGSLRPRLAGARMSLRLLRGHRWVTVAHARTGTGGRFRLRYVPRRLGSWLAQVRYRGVGAAGSGGAGATRRLGVLSSFRPAAASWYGGGGGLACGGVLTSATLGVANRTLPCGTWLTLRYGGRSVRVQVVDRGPYVEGREFDLTEATKRELGFAGIGVVWATR